MATFLFPPRRTQFVHRTMDATRLNVVVNHPQVRPWVGGDGVLDLSSVVENPANFAFEVPHGGFIAVAQGAGRYEVHSMMLPDGRGREALAAVADALEYMFTTTDASEIVTKVPVGNLAASALARAGGFEQMFMSRIRLDAAHAPMTNCYALTLDRWMFHAHAPRIAGEWFHAEVDRLLALHESVEALHEEDEAHNRAAGLAVMMLRAGNAEKAVYYYNRWALLAGYAPIELLGTHPVRVDFHTMIVEIRADEAEVLRCR